MTQSVSKGEVRMSDVFRKRGFGAHKEESKRREKEKESRTGKLWRFFLSDDDEDDAPIRFLTEEPILFYEHNIKVNGKWTNITCTGDDCEECASGGKATYRGAWLVVDGREVEIDEKKDGKKTGKTKVLTDQVRLYVRGSTDIAKLDRLSRKWGLTSRPWFVTKTGKDMTTSYELDRGEESELTVKEITNLLSKIPDKYKKHYNGDEDELYEIVEDNIFGDVIESADSTDDEEEEDKPKKGKKKSTKSKRSRDDEDEDDDDDDDEGDVESGVQRLKPITTKKKPGLKKKTPPKKTGNKVFKKRSS